MSTRHTPRPPRRHVIAAWWLSVLLLLNAGVPLLASVAAHAQGKAVAEVCELHGVVLDAADDAAASASHDAPTDDGAPPKHCPLGALSLLATASGAAPVAASMPVARDAPQASVRAAPPRDAAAAWAARLHHGPPAAA